MLVDIFNIILLLILILVIKKTHVGISLFVAYIFLVPKMLFTFSGVSIDANIMSGFIITILLLHYGGNFSLSVTKYFSPFICLFLLLMAETLFSEMKAPLGFSLAYLFRSLLRFVILPCLTYIVLIKSYKNLDFFIKTFYTVFAIILLYGFGLIFLHGLNPYVSILSSIYDLHDFSNYYDVDSSHRLFGRISSTFIHPMDYSCFLGYTLIFTLFLFSLKRITRKFFIIVISLVVVDLCCCGVRSAIIALLMSFSFYLCIKRNFKTLTYCAVSFALIYVVLSFFPTMKDYVFSIFSSNDSLYGGSSTEMRIDQLIACFDEIKDNVIFGNGYMWHANYMFTHGNHPTILAWESLIFIVLTDSGIVGMLVWGMVAITLLMRIESAEIKTLLFYQLCYMLITGEFGLEHFMYVYTVSLALNYYKNQTSLNEKIILHKV